MIHFDFGSFFFFFFAYVYLIAPAIVKKTLSSTAFAFLSKISWAYRVGLFVPCSDQLIHVCQSLHNYHIILITSAMY